MKIKAFTMAELLIALAVIGVVAALTLPALINKIQMKQYITKLKVDYSILSQVHRLVSAENDFSFKAALTNCTSDERFLKNSCFKKVFEEKIKKVKACDKPYSRTSSNNPCFPDIKDIKYLNGSPVISNAYLNQKCASMVLANGSVLLFWLDNEQCTANGDNALESGRRCGFITIDVNGWKKPNTIGKDIYTLFVKEEGISPLKYEWVSVNEKEIGDCTPDSYGYSCSSVYLNE